jgi:hypothetical protein
MSPALPADQRPVDRTPVHTEDLPDTPRRDANIPAGAWVEAPTALADAAAEVGGREAMYKRRIGSWLLWRSGPARGDHACYVAIDADDLDRSFVFRLDPEGSGYGDGPSGATHDRFRSWKEDLRDNA